jgi:hypothetical protein
MTDAVLNPWQVAIGLAGGLALFLYGLDKIAEGLRAAAGEGMRRLLARLTTNRFAGVATGATLWLRLWIDFDQDGALSDGDLVVLDVPDGDPIEGSFVVTIVP